MKESMRWLYAADDNDDDDDNNDEAVILLRFYSLARCEIDWPMIGKTVLILIWMATNTHITKTLIHTTCIPQMLPANACILHHNAKSMCTLNREHSASSKENNNKKHVYFSNVLKYCDIIQI